LKYRDNPYRFTPKKGTSKNKRRLVEIYLRNFWSFNGEKIKSEMIKASFDYVFYGQAAMNVSWDGQNIQIDHLPIQDQNDPQSTPPHPDESGARIIRTS